MRSDMGKVITERPRKNPYPGSTKGYKKRLQRRGIDDVRREPIKALRGGTKEFTDVLGPIRGFLAKNVGRPWSKVCSEISAALPASGGVSYSHARDHLFEMVEERTQKIDGDVCDSRGMPLRFSADFYVDQHGILRKVKAASYKYRENKPAFPKTDDGEWLAEDDKGIWWAYTMEPYAQTGTKAHPAAATNKYLRSATVPIYPLAYDWMHKQYAADVWTVRRWYGADVYAASRRQLNKREIKRLKLRAA